MFGTTFHVILVKNAAKLTLLYWNSTIMVERKEPLA